MRKHLSIRVFPLASLLLLPLIALSPSGIREGRAAPLASPALTLTSSELPVFWAGSVALADTISNAITLSYRKGVPSDKFSAGYCYLKFHNGYGLRTQVRIQFSMDYFGDGSKSQIYTALSDEMDANQEAESPGHFFRAGTWKDAPSEEEWAKAASTIHIHNVKVLRLDMALPNDPKGNVYEVYPLNRRAALMKKMAKTAKTAKTKTRGNYRKAVVNSNTPSVVSKAVEKPPVVSKAVTKPSAVSTAKVKSPAISKEEAEKKLVVEAQQFLQSQFSARANDTDFWYEADFSTPGILLLREGNVMVFPGNYKLLTWKVPLRDLTEVSTPDNVIGQKVPVISFKTDGKTIHYTQEYYKANDPDNGQSDTNSAGMCIYDQSQPIRHYDGVKTDMSLFRDVPKAKIFASLKILIDAAKQSSDKPCTFKINPD